jgi:DNA-binding transcriptional MerR regulator
MYKIGQFSRVVGVPIRTIHTWERRYGLLKTLRAPSGYRIYSERSVQEARCILGLLSAGVSLSSIVQHRDYDVFTMKADTVDEQNMLEILSRIQKDIRLITTKVNRGEGI